MRLGARGGGADLCPGVMFPWGGKGPASSQGLGHLSLSPRILPDSLSLAPQEATWTPGYTDPDLGLVQLLSADGVGDSGQVTTFLSLSFFICKMGVAPPTP